MGPCTPSDPHIVFALKSPPHPWLTPFSVFLLPGPLCAVVLSLLHPSAAGDENGTAEHDTDVLRDFESTRAVGALGNPRVATAQRDIGARQERRPGPAH